MRPSTVRLLHSLSFHLGPHRKTQVGLLLLLMITTSFAEIFSIGTVLPFLAILTEPERFVSHPLIQDISQTLRISNTQQLLLLLTFTFGFGAILAGGMRLALLWSSTRISYSMGTDLGLSMYERTLHQPYNVHLSRNSSEIIDGIFRKTTSLTYVINMGLNFCSASIILIAIIFTLISIDPPIALTVFGGFGFIYLFIERITRKALLRNSEIEATESVNVIRSLQEGLGGIRDVLLDGSQGIYSKIYRDADQSLRRAQGSSAFISQAPRSALEALGMTLIASLAYILAQKSNGLTGAIPILGALALGAQRILPILQQSYGSWTGIQANLVSLQESLNLLAQPLPVDYATPRGKPLKFESEIKLNNISFGYESEPKLTLRNINITIEKGGFIGFVGATGSGKSSMVDIIMGLLQPTSGTLAIDGIEITTQNQRRWQQHIAHVPQTIFLSDSSIAENIAFGVPKSQIDYSLLRRCAGRAQIAETIEELPWKYDTLVGERGVRLSGGQRQRIGIARALYKKADVLIFDEATSALDNKTEQKVMREIVDRDNGVTLIAIAHRLSSLQNCSQIFEIVDGNVKRCGSYRDLISK